MSNHNELRDLRLEGKQFKNKYKFMILKTTLMPRIKEAFVRSNLNKKKSWYSEIYCIKTLSGDNVFIRS
jgi:hypothetical protein